MLAVNGDIPRVSAYSTGVSIRKVDVSFGAHSVLKSLELEVNPSEFLVLLGSSGCGKSAWRCTSRHVSPNRR